MSTSPTLYPVLLFGDRNWPYAASVRREVRRLHRKARQLGHELLIITGGAPGADQMSEVVGKSENVHVARIDALWDTRHRAAGPERNAIMVALQPLEATCFHEDISKSRGSADTIRRLKLAEIPYKIIDK